MKLRSMVVTLLAAIAIIGCWAISYAQGPLAMGDLENPPITMLGPSLINPNDPIQLVASVAGDSLRVVVIWSHPTDGNGNEDSTTFRIRATKPVVFTTGGSGSVNTWKRRVWSSDHLADTLKLLKPAIGDSVIFTSDSIRQWRKNSGSIPGSAGWGYRRSAAPPAITFIKTTIDSF